MPTFEITSIGAVRNDRTDVQDSDNWGAVPSTIVVDERFGETCLQGLEGFSHVEVLFVFDQLAELDDYREPGPTGSAGPAARSSRSAGASSP